MIPESVRLKAEESVRLQQAYIDSQRPPQQPETAEDATDEPEQDPTQGNPGDDPAPETDQQEDDSKGNPGEQPAPRAEDSVEYWKDRFSHYKQGTDQTIYQLRRELSQVQEREKALAQQVEQSKPANPDQNANPGDSDLTPEELEDLGDLAPVIEKVARRIANQMLNDTLQQRLSPVQQEVGQLRAEQTLTREERFWNALDSSVPTWEGINANPDFHAWLKEIDPVSGVDRQSLLATAQKNLDATRVTAIFNAWDREQPAQDPPRQPVARPSPERKRQPDNRRASTQTPEPEGRIWKTSEIDEFFHELAVDPKSLKSRYTDEQIRATELDIMAAGKEGRVQRG